MDYPANISNNNGEAIMTFNKGKIYVAGGRVATNAFKIYDAAANNWTIGPNLPVNLRTGGGLAIGNKVYIFRSIDAKTKPLVFDIETNTWSEKSLNPITVYPGLQKNYLAKTKDRFIFYLSRLYPIGISIYDTKTDEWKLNVLTLGNDVNLNNVSLLSGNDNTLYMTSYYENNGFVLQKINVEYNK